MSKEKIRLEDNEDNKRLILYEGDDLNNTDFEWIEEKQVDFDSEKGSADFDVILKRKSDGKFFKFFKLKGSAGWRETDFHGVEVVPKQVTLIVYE